MRRVIISVLVLATLALPGSASGAARNFSGAKLGLGLKAYKNQVKDLFPGRLSLQCDEGTTKTDAAGPVPFFRLDPAKQVKKNRKFRVVADKTLSFAALDPITDEPAGVERDRFQIDVTGRFNRRYSKATGTLRFTGSFRGPDPNANIPGEKIQYHNCDSGLVNWSATKSGY